MEQSTPQGVMPGNQEQSPDFYSGNSDPSLNVNFHKTGSDGRIELEDPGYPEGPNRLLDDALAAAASHDVLRISDETLELLTPEELLRDIGGNASKLVVARAQMMGVITTREDLDLAA